MFRLQHAKLSSPIRPEYNLGQLEPWGSSGIQAALMQIVDSLEQWLIWPDKWITIMGSVGIGKTHMLHSLANNLRPWSLYITSSDLQSKVFEAMDRDSNFTVEDVVHIASHAPFLFLDDLGAEYGNSNFAMAILRRIIDYRYQRPEEYVTVVSSNLNQTQIVDFDPRIADRLFDNKIGSSILLNYSQSWRRHV